jgi:hypothetical protein
MVFSMIQQKSTYFLNWQQMVAYLNRFERGVILSRIWPLFISDKLLAELDFYIAIMLFIEI